MNLLEICSRGSYKSIPPSLIGFGLRLLEIRDLNVRLRVFWTTLVRPVGETGQTGQSEFELPDRADRSSTPVRPVCVCCAAFCEVFLVFASVLLPGSFASR